MEPVRRVRTSRRAGGGVLVKAAPERSRMSCRRAHTRPPRARLRRNRTAVTPHHLIPRRDRDRTPRRTRTVEREPHGRRRAAGEAHARRRSGSVERTCKSRGEAGAGRSERRGRRGLRGRRVEFPGWRERSQHWTARFPRRNRHCYCRKQVREGKGKREKKRSVAGNFLKPRLGG